MHWQIQLNMHNMNIIIKQKRYEFFYKRNQTQKSMTSMEKKHTMNACIIHVWLSTFMLITDLYSAILRKTSEIWCEKCMNSLNQSKETTQTSVEELRKQYENIHFYNRWYWTQSLNDFYRRISIEPNPNFLSSLKCKFSIQQTVKHSLFDYQRSSNKFYK